MKTLNTLAIGALIGILSVCLVYSQEVNELPTAIKVDTIYKDRMVLTEENVLYWLVELDVKEISIVMAQIELETGNLTSRRCLKLNNLCGFQYSEEKPLHFSHWLQSLIYYKQWQDEYYNEEEYTDYYQFLLEFNYAQDEEYILKLKQF